MIQFENLKMIQFENGSILKWFGANCTFVQVCDATMAGKRTSAGFKTFKNITASSALCIRCSNEFVQLGFQNRQ